MASIGEENENSRDAGGPQAVERALRVLTTLAAHPQGVSLADLARHMMLPLSTTHRLLAALSHRGFVRETPTGLRRLGPTTVVLAAAFLEGVDLRAEARPVMQQVVNDHKETCHLGLLVSAQIVYIEKVESPYAVRMVSRIGGTAPAVTTAIGRAILAYSPDPLVESTVVASERLLDHLLDRDEFHQKLELVRRSGFSTDLEENELGVCCVGAPVFDHNGEVVAAMSISVPTGRFDRGHTKEMGDAIRQAANTVSEAHGWYADAARVPSAGSQIDHIGQREAKHSSGRRRQSAK